MQSGEQLVVETAHRGFRERAQRPPNPSLDNPNAHLTLALTRTTAATGSSGMMASVLSLVTGAARNNATWPGLGSSAAGPQQRHLKWGWGYGHKQGTGRGTHLGTTATAASTTGTGICTGTHLYTASTTGMGPRSSSRTRVEAHGGVSPWSRSVTASMDVSSSPNPSPALLMSLCTSPGLTLSLCTSPGLPCHLLLCSPYP